MTAIILNLYKIEILFQINMFEASFLRLNERAGERVTSEREGTGSRGGTELISLQSLFA